MSDIFISYASKDRDRAEIIAKALSDHGWAVWWDRTIPAGQTFCTVIEEALAEAKCVMVLWSRHSVSSNWVQEEAEEGRKKAILIPVFIEKVRPPMGFRSFQAADLTDWDGVEKTPSFKKLIADITNVIGPPLNLIEEREKTDKKEDKNNTTEEKKHKPNKEEENKVEELEKSKKKTENNFRPSGGKKDYRKHFILGICAIVFVLIGIVFLFLPIKVEPPPTKFELLDFRKHSLADAKKYLFDNKIDFKTDPEAFRDIEDSQLTSNIVIIGQKPEAGAEMPMKKEVMLEIGIKIPNFKEQTYSDAKKYLVNNKIDFKTDPEAFRDIEDSQLTSNMVIVGQKPEAGAEMPMEKEVMLEIGIKMPNFRNRPYSEAKKYLGKHKIDYETISSKNDHKLEDSELEGYMLIIGQKPKPGETIIPEKLSEVVLTIKKELVKYHEEDVKGTLNLGMRERHKIGWGRWAPQKDLCYKGTYAYAFKLKVEGNQKGGDDTALNAIRLYCRNKKSRNVNSVISSEGPFGGWWRDMVTCNEGEYFYAANIKLEGNQKGGDDTAANDLKMRCGTYSGVDKGEIAGKGAPWGSWGDTEKRCPDGTAICGMKTAIEPNRRDGDDTALTDVEFYCCELK